jgi:hypothetical protein
MRTNLYKAAAMQLTHVENSISRMSKVLSLNINLQITMDQQKGINIKTKGQDSSRKSTILVVFSNLISHSNDTLDGKQMAFMDYGKEKRPLQIHRNDLLEKLQLKDQELHFGQTEIHLKIENLKSKQTLENTLNTLNEEHSYFKRLRENHERTLNLEK